MRTLSIVSILFIVLSCDSNEQGLISPNTYFQFEVSTLYTSKETDDWIVIHNRDNQLLAAKPFETGSKLVFDTTAVLDDFIVSIFSVSNGSHFTIETFNAVKPGGKWRLDPIFPFVTDYGSTLGTASVEIDETEISDPTDCMVSDKFQALAPGISINGKKIFIVKIGSKVDDFFMCVTDKSGTPRYHLAENVVVGQTYKRALNDYSAYDKVISISLPEPSLSVFGETRSFEEGQPYNLAHGYYTNFLLFGLSSGKTSRAFGYLDRFTRQMTSLHASYNTYRLTYRSYGAAPSANVSLTKANVSLANNTFDGFSTSGSTYDWRDSEYYKQVDFIRSTRWKIHSPMTDMKNYPLPQEFTNKFPSFDAVDLAHQITYFNSGGQYDNYISERFEQKEPVAGVIVGTGLK